MKTLIIIIFLLSNIIFSKNIGEIRISRREIIEKFNLSIPNNMRFIKHHKKKYSNENNRIFSEMNIIVEQNDLKPAYGKCYFKNGFYYLPGKIIDISSYSNNVGILTEGGKDSYYIFIINTYINNIKCAFKLDRKQYFEYGKPVSVMLYNEKFFISFLSGFSKGALLVFNLEYGKLIKAKKYSFDNME